VLLPIADFDERSWLSLIGSDGDDRSGESGDDDEDLIVIAVVVVVDDVVAVVVVVAVVFDVANDGSLAVNEGRCVDAVVDADVTTPVFATMGASGAEQRLGTTVESEVDDAIADSAALRPTYSRSHI
jgi:hypothetical protein